MSKLRKCLAVGVLAAVMVVSAPGIAQAYSLKAADLSPNPVPAGQPITICYTLGDYIMYSTYPYEVEAYFGEKGPSEFFKCGMTFGFTSSTLWHSAGGLFPPSWQDRLTDLNLDGMTKIYEAAHPGAAGQTFCFDWMPPANLEVGKTYWIHLLVGFNGECNNWTHYSLPFTVTGGGQNPPVPSDGITGTNATWDTWTGMLITEKPGNKSGVMYWVQANTGTTRSEWSFTINEVDRAGDFGWRGNPADVQVYVNGVMTAAYKGADWEAMGRTFKYTPTSDYETVIVRTKYDYKVPNDLPQTYTFSSLVSEGTNSWALSKQLLVY